MPPAPSHPPSNPAALVALVAADRAGLDALAPAGEMLDSFAVGRETLLFPPCAVFPGREPGWRVIIAASGDALLPAAMARHTGLPVVRVPVPEGGRGGLALVYDEGGNLPAGEGGAEEAFATMAIGEAGAKNAALFAVATLALTDPQLSEKWRAFRAWQTEAVLREPAPELED